MDNTKCPDANELLVWLLDPLDCERHKSLTPHLDSCADCQNVLEQLADAGDNLFADLFRQPPADVIELEPECARAGVLAEAAFDTFSASDSTARGPSAVDVTALPRLDNYELLGVLGHGGMGVVYQARHTGLNRPAAVKMILGGRFADPVAQARFQIEAEVIARLRHPHVVQVYEFGRCDDLPYFVLEYVGGGSLAEKLKADGRFAPRAAAEMVAKLSNAMTAAHAQGVVHRDLKPANVLLTEAGEPKVTDFGLAKVDDSGATASGAIMGTPSYMAPEQAAGNTKDAGTAADVYALGAILYTLLTGRPPFAGDTVMGTIQQVLAKEPAPPQSLVPGVPRDLQTVCLKCLEKNPAKRYSTAAALADDLTRYLQGKPIKARPVGRLERTVKWVKRNPVVAGATTAVVLALVGGTTVSYLKYRDAEHHRGVAEGKEKEAVHEADKAKKARDFLVSIFELSDANGRRGTMTARQILDDAERRIPREFADQPELQAELLAAVETVYAKITSNAPLAMILDVRGTVRLQSDRNPNQQPAPHMLLYAGDRLSLAADGDVRLVFLSDLHQERLGTAREATVRRKGCEPADAVRERDDNLMLTFVRLPKAMFYMGWDGPEKPGVKTEIAEDFQIAVHAVTQGQWQEVMGNNPSSFSRYGASWQNVKAISDEELKLFPVEGVNWDDAQEFIGKLNERVRGRGWVYRLPTAAEWEYACRAGATSEADCSHHFYFATPTDAIGSVNANFNGAHPFGGAAAGTCLGRPTRVGTYPPNVLGLCDMHCNVQQWCRAEGPLKPLRGGGWGSDGYYCRAAYSVSKEPWVRNEGHGFRLVRVVAR